MNLRSAPGHSVAIGWMLAALLAGCPHSPERALHEPAVAHAADVEHPHKPAPPKGGPLPPRRVVEPAQVDRSCQAGADCVMGSDDAPSPPDPNH